jgi:pyruvate dehydrogenase E1 component alpha subunit
MAKAMAAEQQNMSKQGHNSKLNAEELLQYYKDMLLIRRFEEKAGQLYGMGLIGGFCHLYIGQEAVVVGARAATKKGDGCITGYRDHGHCLMWGMTPESVMAELTGRAAGCSKGKGGSMHMFNVPENFFGGHGIVGAQIPLGVGMAFAHKYEDNDHVTMAFIGDGGANQGQVYEAFNMAALWKLPVIFVIENNGYAMGTAVKRAASGTALYNRGAGFGIEGKEVDGMDVLAVKAAVKEAADKCRKGEGPIILEMKTYRYRGHSMSDPAKYRTKDEVETMKEKHDPIEHVKKLIMDNGFATEDQLTALDKDIKKQINDAAEFAKTTPEPDESELWTDVYLTN